MSVLPFGYRVSRTDKNVCPPFRLSRQQDRQECLSSLSVIASAGQTRMSVLPFGYRVSGTDKNVCPPFRLSRQRDRQECLSSLSVIASAGQTRMSVLLLFKVYLYSLQRPSGSHAERLRID